MSCSTDYGHLTEVVVGRAEHKPHHLHDEPATRKKLTVAGVVESSKTDLRVKDESRMKSEAAKAAWRKHLLQTCSQEYTLYSDAKDRHKKCCEQVQTLVDTLRENGINVLRPDVVPGWEAPTKTPWWETQWQYGTPCPRDLFIKFGDLLVETYSGWRCRYFEGEAYYNCLEDHCERTDSRFVKMPRGILSEKLYPGWSSEQSINGEEEFEPARKASRLSYELAGGKSVKASGSIYTDHCAIIEAADIRRYGEDVMMQVGGYSNRKGFRWLERLLRGEKKKLWEMTFAAGQTSYYHLDAKFSAIDESTILYSADTEHMPSQEIFDWFKERDWNLVEAPKRMVLVSPEDFCSSGLNLNWLCLEPRKILLDKGEKETVKFLQEEFECDCVTMDFSSAFEFGGAFNCWTVDLTRK